MITRCRLSSCPRAGTAALVRGMSRSLFVTTGDCVEQPQVGFQAESIVALDAVEGTVLWYHQRRLTDTSDYDIGNTPAVVDVEGENGCRVVVSPDKNGCIYGFRQTGDLPQVGSAAGGQDGDDGECRDEHRSDRSE